VLDDRRARNTVARTPAAGIFLDLDPATRTAAARRRIEVPGQPCCATRDAPRSRAGLVVAGNAAIALCANTFAGNAGASAVRHARCAAARRAPGVAPREHGDDTRWLQARLDRGGGTIFLPKLPGDACYRSRGSGSRTTTRRSPPTARASSRSGSARCGSSRRTATRSRRAPSSSSNVRREAASGAGRRARSATCASSSARAGPLYGVAVFAHDVTLSRLDIGGEPKDDVTISGRATATRTPADVSVLDSS
jgi:hypothetical protein